MPSEMKLECPPSEIEPKWSELLAGLGPYAQANIPVVLALEVMGMTVLTQVKAVSVTGTMDGREDHQLILLWAGNPIGTTGHRSDEGAEVDEGVQWVNELEV